MMTARKVSFTLERGTVKWREPEWEGAPLGSFTSPNGLAFRKQEVELSVGEESKGHRAVLAVPSPHLLPDLKEQSHVPRFHPCELILLYLGWERSRWRRDHL